MRQRLLSIPLPAVELRMILDSITALVPVQPGDPGVLAAFHQEGMHIHERGEIQVLRVINKNADTIALIW